MNKCSAYLEKMKDPVTGTVHPLSFNAVKMAAQDKALSDMKTPSYVGPSASVSPTNTLYKHYKVDSHPGDWCATYKKQKTSY